MSWPDYISGILLGVMLGLGVGCVLSERSFRARIRDKADTGIRMESDGRLYTIHSVEMGE